MVTAFSIIFLLLMTMVYTNKTKYIQFIQTGECLQVVDFSLALAKCDDDSLSQDVILLKKEADNNSFSSQLQFMFSNCLAKYPNKTAGVLPCSLKARNGTFTSVNFLQNTGMLDELYIGIGNECLSGPVLKFVHCNQSPSLKWRFNNNYTITRKKAIVEKRRLDANYSDIQGNVNNNTTSFSDKDPNSSSYIFNQNTLLKYNLIIKEKDFQKNEKGRHP